MSEGSAWYIWSGSKVKDLAAEYIDFVSDPRWLDTWIKDGYTIPIQKTPIDFSKYGISGVIAKAFNTGTGMVDRNVDAFHTTAPPRVTFVMYNDIQGVLTGDTPIADFLKKLDEQDGRGEEGRRSLGALRPGLPPERGSASPQMRCRPSILRRQCRARPESNLNDRRSRPPEPVPLSWPRRSSTSRIWIYYPIAKNFYLSFLGSD